MGSAEIRALIDQVPPVKNPPKFSITGPDGPHAQPVRERVNRIINNLRLQTDEKLSKEREQELSSKDIYTRKARFSQNVHYLDKNTDKTSFVDTGKSIALRGNGITEAGVAVALQLAQQRFGSNPHHQWFGGVQAPGGRGGSQGQSGYSLHRQEHEPGIDRASGRVGHRA